MSVLASVAQDKIIYEPSLLKRIIIIVKRQQHPCVYLSHLCITYIACSPSALAPAGMLPGSLWLKVRNGPRDAGVGIHIQAGRAAARPRLHTGAARESSLVSYFVNANSMLCLAMHYGISSFCLRKKAHEQTKRLIGKALWPLCSMPGPHLSAPLTQRQIERTDWAQVQRCLQPNTLLHPLVSQPNRITAAAKIAPRENKVLQLTEYCLCCFV